MSTAHVERHGTHDHELSLTDARAALPDIVNRARYAGDSVYITRHGHRVAAIVPAEVLEEIEAAEDRMDAAEVERVRAEGGNPVDWETAKEEFGL